jgi:hypothetical protein
MLSAEYRNKPYHTGTGMILRLDIIMVNKSKLAARDLNWIQRALSRQLSTDSYSTIIDDTGMPAAPQQRRILSDRACTTNSRPTVVF